MSRRLTKAEREAICVALNQVLAGPLDGSPEPEEEERLVALMESALAKLWSPPADEDPEGRA